MAICHRKLFMPLCNLDSPPPPRPPPPPPPLMLHVSTANQNPDLSSAAILVFCALAVSFLLFLYMTLVKKYYIGSNDSSLMNPPAFDFELNLSASNLDRGGLRQSIIESIAVFKYKREEGLIEGTECSVCLNEYQEDETLRLLPKCSHAFHIPCIDTWLRSHKSCPMCRAPIMVSDAAGSDLNRSAENLENRTGLESDREGGTNETRVGDEFSGGFPSEEEEKEEELQHVGRPTSKGEIEGCSSCRLVRENKLNLDAVAKEVERSTGRFRVTKSSSFGHSFPKGPVAVNRSSSFSGKVAAEVRSQVLRCQ